MLTSFTHHFTVHITLFEKLLSSQSFSKNRKHTLLVYACKKLKPAERTTQNCKIVFSKLGRKVGWSKIHIHVIWERGSCPPVKTMQWRWQELQFGAQYGLTQEETYDHVDSLVSFFGGFCTLLLCRSPAILHSRSMFHEGIRVTLAFQIIHLWLHSWDAPSRHFSVSGGHLLFPKIIGGR